MNRREFLGGAAIAVAIAASGHSVSAQNGNQFRDWKPSALADTAQVRPRAACATLMSLTGYDLTIVTASSVPASADAPAHCRVLGQIQPEIRFEVSLPAAWNGRLYMFGNSGYAGEALDGPPRVTTVRRALARGFAVAQTNTGHDAAAEPLGTFAASSQKLLDYAYRAVHVTALTAKRILQTYYDGFLRHSYFDGCSTGGRQGLISAQRFPEDFDGIVVGAPVLDFSGTMISYAAIERALAAAPIAPAKARLLADHVYRVCDKADGVADGLIDDPPRCAFKPAADLPRCSNDADGPDCFTSAQIHTIETVYAPVTRGGRDFFPGWPLGAETPGEGPNAVPTGWMPFLISGQRNGRSIAVSFMETFLRNIAFGRALPTYDWTTFDLDKDLDKLQFARTILDATDPDLSRFKARGGRILSYFGWADGALNPLMGVNYYERVTAQMGPSTPEFYRLFMVPGMFHCGGGIGVSAFDALTPLVEWVETGNAPRSILGSKIAGGKAVRTRPLCPYPEVAKYRGTGSIDDASNFTCR